jgi:hypothetical protein
LIVPPSGFQRLQEKGELGIAGGGTRAGTDVVRASVVRVGVLRGLGVVVVGVAVVVGFGVVVLVVVGVLHPVPTSRAQY